MSYIKNLFLFSCLISITSSFCMHNNNNNNSQPAAKRQKIDNSKQITECLEKNSKENILDKKLAALRFQEIKQWENLSSFAGFLIAYQTNIVSCRSIKSYFKDLKYALVSKDKIICKLCNKNGYNLDFLYETKTEKVDFALCKEKMIGNVFFKVRLLTLEEVKKITELVNTGNFILGYSSNVQTKLFISQLKINNLLQEEKLRYLNKKTYPIISLILLSKKGDKNSLFFMLPWDIIKIIIKLWVDDIKNNSLDLLLDLESKDKIYLNNSNFTK